MYLLHPQVEKTEKFFHSLVDKTETYDNIRSKRPRKLFILRSIRPTNCTIHTYALKSRVFFLSSTAPPASIEACCFLCCFFFFSIASCSLFLIALAIVLLSIGFAFGYSTMPKGKQRPKRDVPIKARYNFCIHCLRHVNNNFDPKEDTVYNISCLLNARASIICRFCADGNKTCDPVGFACPVLYMCNLLMSVKPVTGLLGNTRDLVKIIEWAAAILDEDYWNSDVKQTINEKVHVLSKIFDSVEGAHARKFSLKGTKTAKHVSPRYN